MEKDTVNSDHLGDSLDFAKGGILGLVMPILNSPVVIPMLTDQARWTGRHFALYARILGLPIGRILLRSRAFDACQRKEYFSGIVRALPTHTDIFLDPDTGFRHRGGKANRRIRCGDIRMLLDQNQERVVIVYCHRREGVHKLTRDLRTAMDGSQFAFAYAGAACAMLFLSNNVGRLDLLRSYLSGLLAPVNGERLTPILHAS
jgi:hypothetical protein